jgi:hypothetical protein
MNHHVFALQPFAIAQPELEIIGTLSRHSPLLNLSYTLLGAVDAVDIPAPAHLPTRHHELWQSTCFEFFLGLQGSPQYWEFNLSPAGHWNVYRFEDYRQGMIEEPTVTTLPITLRIEPDAVSLSLTFDLDNLIPFRQTLDVAISAVLQTKAGKLSYWALTHPGPKADFHRRDSFTLCLEPG